MASVATRTHSLPHLPNCLVGRLAYLASLRVAWEGKVRAGAQGGQSGCLLPSAHCQAGLVITSVPRAQQVSSGESLDASCPPLPLPPCWDWPLQIPESQVWRAQEGTHLVTESLLPSLKASSDNSLTPSQAIAPLVLAVTLLALPPLPSQASQPQGVPPPLVLGYRPGEQF